ELDEAPAPPSAVVARLDGVDPEPALVAERGEERGLALRRADAGPQHGGVEGGQSLGDGGLVGQRAEDLAELLERDELAPVPVTGDRQRAGQGADLDHPDATRRLRVAAGQLEGARVAAQHGDVVAAVAVPVPG